MRMGRPVELDVHCRPAPEANHGANDVRMYGLGLILGRRTADASVAPSAQAGVQPDGNFTRRNLLRSRCLAYGVNQTSEM